MIHFAYTATIATNNDISNTTYMNKTHFSLSAINHVWRGHF